MTNQQCYNLSPDTCKLKCEFSYYPFSIFIILTQQGVESALLLGGLDYGRKFFNVVMGGLNEMQLPSSPQTTTQ